MKNLFKFLFFFLLSSQLFASPISQIVFFGDSLSDNGNLYNMIFKLIPKSPPYYEGRFSNGPTWAERVGDYYYSKYYINYKIYAVGGATAIFHMPTTKFVAPSILDWQIRSYLLESPFTDRSNILYVIWIGANDYLTQDVDDGDALTSQVVAKISWAVDTLIDNGARNFLLLNLPDLSRAPKADGSPDKLRLRALSLMHNLKLDQMYAETKARNPQSKFAFIDIYGTFLEALTTTDRYNQEFNVNITDTTTACWDGGYRGMRHENAMLQANLTAEIKAASKDKSSPFANIDAATLSQYIMSNPSLSEVYRTAQLKKMGIEPCSNADQHLFWDHLHPTSSVHKVIAGIAIKTLEDDITKTS